MQLSREEFEVAVGDALDSVPAELLDQAVNVAFVVEEEPPPDQPDDLLGLYDGLPMTEDAGWGGNLPAKISIFRGPLNRLCEDREELLDEIAVTVVHELAHHFGIEDERLEELGWG